MKKTCALIFLTILTASIWAEKISVAVNPGKYYSKRSPQIAIWIENSEGKYVDTLFVTKKASSNKWIGSPKDGRPESLPDWYRAKGQNPAVKISKDEVDATTSATPKKGIIIEKNINLEKGKEYTIKCQVNQSFDYNIYYNKINSGVNGQPAVLYSGSIIPNGKEIEIKLELKTKKDFLTTADKIIESIYVVVE